MYLENSMLENFKYIKNIENGQGNILLYSQIGDSVDENGNYVYGISGSSFANELTWLTKNCEVVNVRINSVGGSVIDGYSIVSAILNSPVPVHTYIDGLAASTAGWVAVSGNKCHMMDYGTFMMHNPEGGDNKAVLRTIKDTIVTILSNRTGLSPEEVDKLMNKETWLNAKECLDKKIVDEVISSGKKVKVNKKTNLFDMALVYNKLINKNKMEKVTNVLSLNNDASEESIVSAIEKLNTENTTLKSEKDALQARLDALEAENKAREIQAAEVLKNKAASLVEKAVKEGKLQESEKEATILNASKDEASFEFVSNLISKLGNGKTAVKVFDFSKVTDKTGNVSDRSTWSFSEWSKKDPEGLKKMQNESPEDFVNLYNLEFKK